MALKTNLAYNNYIELEKREKVHIGKVKRKKLADRIRPSYVICVVLIISSLFAFLVFNMVRLNEVTSEVNMLEKQYKIQQSEQVRLNAELESKMSDSNIEQYAQNKWGMRKQTNNQINYITVSQGNSIELNDDDNGGILGKLLNDVKKVFS